MNCPYCGKEMESGLVQMGRLAAWVKKKHKVSLLPREGEVLLGNNYFTGLEFPADICKSCHKIVLDYAGAAFEEG